MLDNIFHAIKAAGGFALIVGGAVRDQVLGIDSKDVDVEVYGLDQDTLVKVLSEFGTVDLVGVSFGVFKVHGLDVDFSLPRTDSKAGTGHKGFHVETNAGLTPHQAARRRDFTMNAMAMDPITGRLFDFFGGRRDLADGRLRATSAQFVDDPLRPLRGFQFCGRFDLRADGDTLNMCWDVAGEFGTLAVERIWGEWWKWATRSVKPSAGLFFLRDAGWLQFFPEVGDLRGLLQDPEWHPEGSVFTHTALVVDAAAQIAIRDGLPAEQRGVLVLAALLHDVGKAVTTTMQAGRIVSPGHAQAGVEIAGSFLDRIGCPDHIRRQVLPMIAEHMVHLNEINDRTVRRLAVRLGSVSIQDLVRLIEADHSGRAPLPAGVPAEAVRLLNVARWVNALDAAPRPILMGRHLVDRGAIPGPHFGTILNAAFAAQLDGEFNDLEGALAWLGRQ